MLQMDLKKRGPGYWKFNISLLKDNNYKKEVKELIKIEKAKKYKDVIEKWECIKLTIRGFTIQYAAKKKKSKKNLLNVIEKKIIECKQDLVNGSELFSAQELSKHLHELQQERVELIKYKAQEAAVRARQNWLNFGRKKLQIFLSIGKTQL